MTNSSVSQSIFRVLLSLFMLFAGIGHLTFARAEFQAQVPDFVPVNKDLVVLLSGVVEIVIGLSLIFIKKYRVQVGWFVAIFFVLVFAGNVHQYVDGISAFGLDTDTKRLIRLFFQPVLIIWVLWSTGAWNAWRSKK